MHCRNRCALGNVLATLAWPVLLTALCLGWVSNATAQQTTQVPAPATAPLAFDAISIHPSHVGTTTDGDVSIWRTVTSTPGDGYKAENVSLKIVIVDAYNIKPNYISGGPDWIDSDAYDINAKVVAADGTAPLKLTKTQRRQMLQTMLADRFKLVVHNETKDAPIYELDIAKGGPKLHASTPGNDAARGVTGPDGQFHPGLDNYVGNGVIIEQGYPLSYVADLLTSMLHRPVVDKTGLTGKYDISLRWTPDNTPVDSPLAGGPSIFTAAQEQLGLKLTSTHGPVKTLVIDHVERPTPN